MPQHELPLDRGMLHFLTAKLANLSVASCKQAHLAPPESFYHSHDITGEGYITLQRSSKIGKVCGMQHWGTLRHLHPWLFSNGHTT